MRRTTKGAAEEPKNRKTGTKKKKNRKKKIGLKLKRPRKTTDLENSTTVVPGQVHPGETVKQGQPLLVLSAMKMETNVASPADGIVKALHVKEGDNIQGNDLVAEIDV